MREIVRAREIEREIRASKEIIEWREEGGKEEIRKWRGGGELKRGEKRKKRR